MKSLILSVLLSSQFSFASNLTEVKSTLFTSESRLSKLVQSQKLPEGGTLLVCAQATLTALGNGGTQMRCLGSNGIYKVTLKSMINIADSGIGLNIIYFKNAQSTTEIRQSCFLGGKLGGAYLIGGSVMGLKQQRCDIKKSQTNAIFDSGLIDGGFLYGFGAELGLAADIGLEKAIVEKIDLFGKNIEDGIFGQHNGATSL